jgi:hypothetical protein
METPQMKIHEEQKIDSPIRMSNPQDAGNWRNNVCRWFQPTPEYKSIEVLTGQRPFGTEWKGGSRVRSSRVKDMRVRRNIRAKWLRLIEEYRSL